MFKILSTNEITVADSRLGISCRQYETPQSFRLERAAFILAAGASVATATSKMFGVFSAYIPAGERIQINDFVKDGRAVMIEPGSYAPQGAAFKQLVPHVPGDLSYIDGCSNSILIGPQRNGEPCTNYLYFPPQIKQTIHTHPSVRIGLILSGEGQANLPDGPVKLKPGMTFILDKHTQHGFETENSAMSLMVFHPDSDSGPTDEFNAMKTRTYIR